MKTKLNKSYLFAALIISGTYGAQQKPKKDTAKTQNIAEVTLTKKVFKKEADRFVFDVAASPAAKGNTAFGILKETPLVSTTDDKTLTVAGKSSAIIFINGRKSTMNGEALIEMLKTTPAENIQKIEVITMPGSEYNVEASDAIINIVMKKKMTDGLNGNFLLNNTQSYFNMQSASVSLNYRKSKLGISGSISGSDQARAQGYLLKNGKGAYQNTSEGKIFDPNLNLGGYLNVDYELSKKSNIALSWNNWNNKSYDSTSDLFNITTGLNEITGQPETYLSRTINKEDARSYNNSLNLNYELKTDSLGSKLNANISYLNYKRYQRNDNQTYNSNINRDLLDVSSSIKQQTPQLIDSYGATLDYVKKFQKDLTFSLGGSFSQTKTDNNSYFERLNSSGLFETDINQTNHFVYDEKIFGYYLTGEKRFSEKLTTKLGLRLETTDATGNVLNTGQTIERNDTNWLPYASFSYDLKDNHNISYAFTSRMRRPSFWEINPVRNQLTEQNYTQNNPFMKSASIYSHELTYMYKQSYYLILGYSKNNDDSSQIPLQRIDESGKPEIRYIRTNFGDKTQASATLGMQKSFFDKIWTSNLNTGIQRNHIKGFLDRDPLDPQTVFEPYTMNREYYTFFLQSNNNIRLSKNKDLFMTANFFYYSPQLLNIGVLRPLSKLDLGIKKLWNDWTFALDFRDILRTNIVKIDDTDNNGNTLFVQNDNYSRSASISVSYSFGNKKLQKMRQLESANQEIRSRTR